MIKSIIKAARPRTLPLSLSSIISGNAIAYYLQVFDASIFVLTLICTILLQILSNFANDLGDYEKGTDNPERIGPKRTIQSGEVSPTSMKKYISITIILCLISGIVLLYMSKLLFIEKATLFVTGVFAILAAYFYTMSDKAYGYKGFGDIAVFIFFGMIGVLGSLFLQIHHINNAAILPAIGVGLLSVSVLHLNNMRDMESDKKNNKRTFAGIIGKENSKLYFLLLVLFAILCWGGFVYTQNVVSNASYIYWIGLLPLLWILSQFWKVKKPVAYDQFLKPVAMITFITSVLFFFSQIFYF